MSYEDVVHEERVIKEAATYDEETAQWEPLLAAYVEANPTDLLFADEKGKPKKTIKLICQYTGREEQEDVTHFAEIDGATKKKHVNRVIRYMYGHAGDGDCDMQSTERKHVKELARMLRDVPFFRHVYVRKPRDRNCPFGHYFRDQAFRNGRKFYELSESKTDFWEDNRIGSHQSTCNQPQYAFKCVINHCRPGF